MPSLSVLSQVSRISAITAYKTQLPIRSPLWNIIITHTCDHLLTHEAPLVEVPGPRHRHHGVHAPGEVVGLKQEVAEEDGGRHQPADDGRVLELGGESVLVLQTLAQRHP